MGDPETATTAPVDELDTDTWVAEYGDYLYRYALLRLRDPTNAEDVVQETFLAGIKNLDRFDSSKGQIKYWLRGILRNKIVDYIRKAVREMPLEDEEVTRIRDSMAYKAFGVPEIRPAPWQFDPHRAFEKQEFREIFRTCLGGLKGVTARAATMKMADDMETDEICKVLEIEPNYLWVLLHRARAQLKDCLEKNWDKKEA